MIDTKLNRKALTEVYEIILMLSQSEYEKIPKSMINGIKENRDTEYEVDFDDLRRGNLLVETENILATLYVYYLATEEEKCVINQMIELEKKQKYKMSNLFLKQKNEESKKQVALEVVKENVLVKLVNKLKEYLRKSK